MAPSANPLVAVLWFLLAAVAMSQSPDETRLRDKLFKGDGSSRNAHSRPVQLHNHTVDVTLHLGISHILHVDEKLETLTLNGWFYQEWFDASVMWNPTEYGGLESIRVPCGLLWHPDVTVVNSASYEDSRPFSDDVNMFVEYTGHVYWVLPTTMNVVCALDFAWFPHDQHHCSVEILSWVLDGSLVNISLAWPHDNLTYDGYFDPHGEWEVVRSYATMNYAEYSELHWPTAQFHVDLRRRAPYYYLTLIVPAIVSAAMTLATFWLSPLARNEKLTVSSINVLLLTVLLIQVYWVVPRSGDSVPGILILCANLHSMTGVSLILAIVSSLVYARPRPSTPFPSWVNLVIHNPVLHKVLCLDSSALSGESVDDGLMASSHDEEGGEPKLTEFKTKDSALGNEWYLIACILDKVAFYVYCLTFAILTLATLA